MIKKADIVLLIVIIAVSLTLCFIPFSETKGDTLKISINNEEYMTVSLNEDRQIKLPENTVIIENGCAFVKSSHCPDKVCINQGKISKKGETIICLPAKAVLEVE